MTIKDKSWLIVRSKKDKSIRAWLYSEFRGGKYYVFIDDPRKGNLGHFDLNDTHKDAFDSAIVVSLLYNNEK